jgi:alpha-glucoside transport system substrate-binding protein
MTEWAKAGALKPLDDVLDVATYTAETAPALVELGTVDGKISGVFIKAAVKGLIWFNPQVYTGGEPATWDALQATSPAPADKLWCIGLESGAASGWPGTDWIEDIVLRQSGPEVYDGWVPGREVVFAIKSAFEAFGAAAANSRRLRCHPTTVRHGGNGCSPIHPAACSTIRPASSPRPDQEGGPPSYDFFRMPDINPPTRV